MTQTLPVTKQLDYRKAKTFAIHQHKVVGQKYGDKPYSYHLAQVDHWCEEFSPVLEADMGDDDYTWLVRAGAYVHDLLEDTKITYNDLVKETNKEIAEIAYLLQTPKGRNRKERHSAAYYQEIATNREATFVKLCDRIANVHYSLENQSSMYQKYQQEQEHFAKYLQPAWPELEKVWDHLTSLLSYKMWPPLK